MRGRPGTLPSQVMTPLLLADVDNELAKSSSVPGSRYGVTACDTDASCPGICAVTWCCICCCLQSCYLSTTSVLETARRTFQTSLSFSLNILWYTM